MKKIILFTVLALIVISLILLIANKDKLKSVSMGQKDNADKQKTQVVWPNDTPTEGVVNPNTPNVVVIESLDPSKDCTIIQRNSINITASDVTRTDKSLVSCKIDGKDTEIFEITDKVADSKNNIYRFWISGPKAYALIVDQNGGGSGEGNGKIISFDNFTHELLSCFKYVPEVFVGSQNSEPTEPENEFIWQNSLDLTDKACTNYQWKLLAK
jgi:hypothetical protein